MQRKAELSKRKEAEQTKGKGRTEREVKQREGKGNEDFFSVLTHPAVSQVEITVPKIMPPYTKNCSNGLNAGIRMDMHPSLLPYAVFR